MKKNRSTLCTVLICTLIIVSSFAFLKISDLNKENKRLVAACQNNIESLYPDALPLNVSANNPGEDYIQHFRISGNTVYVQLQNDRSYQVQPNFVITFLDEFGRCIGFVSQKWAINRLNPGASKNDTLHLSRLHEGTPAYYIINLN